jgi:hypothetical protein
MIMNNYGDLFPTKSGADRSTKSGADRRSVLKQV